MTKKFLVPVAVLLLAGYVAFAQSGHFRLGQWLELNNAILSNLSREYVDTLPVSRMSRSAIDAMLSQLDPYTVYVPEEENEDFQMSVSKVYGGIGAIIYKPEKEGYVIINEPYEGSPAARGGLQCGDQIMEIDGVSTIGLEAAQSSDRMKGKPGTTVHFKVKKVRSGEIKDIDIVRERIHLPDIEYAGMLDGETGYVLQTGFTENVSRQIREAFLDLKSKGMKRFILDLRGNGGGLLGEAVNIVSLFVPTGSLVVSQMGRDSTDRREYRTVMTPIDTEMPIAILVDGASASASEIVAGAIQDLDRGVVMGRRTYGKGLVQSIRPLPYNGQLKVTVAKYYTPSGRCVQAIDYSKREEDGSVGHIPDSLTHEFKTLRLGRSVRDGGGITPDIALTYHPYTRLVYSLVVNGIIEQYTLKYVGEHETIPAVEDFHFTDYNDFVEFAKGKKFDSRTGAMALFDQMKDELVKDGLQDKASAEIEALQKALEISKEELLWLRKDEVTPWIEEEIAVRYYYQGAGIKIRLRYDREVAEALKNSFLLSN
ncbi:MAG: S41 family peptidase [Bacteroidales bacterium]|nr:S41 family peptidase [Bacteroidales bacterium]